MYNKSTLEQILYAGDNVIDTTIMKDWQRATVDLLVGFP